MNERDKKEFKEDMAEFRRHKKACGYFAKACDDCDTFADSILDHLATALDRLHGGRRFMDEACK